MIVIVGDLRDELVIDAQQELSPLSSQVILMPFLEAKIIRARFERHFFCALLAVGIKYGALALEGEIVAAKLVVEPRLPGHLIIIIHLIACHVAIRQTPAAELKSAIDGRGVCTAQTK